jgi:hypothetical protein
VALITTIRHPCDVLISLYHHVNKFEREAVDQDELRRMLREGFARVDIRPGAEQPPFYSDLACSIDWMRSGASRVIRYEDLQRDPVGALKQVTDQIQPVSIDAIERALEQCDMGMLRMLAGKASSKFFREGKVGGWREILSPAVLDDLRRLDPYPEQFAALGYTLDPDDPSLIAPAAPRPSKNPFRAITHFDNGVPVSMLLVRLYLSVPSEISAGWQPVTRTDAGSFFAWANAPAADDPQGADGPLPLTNLALYAYRSRADVQEIYPDVFGRHRPDVAEWFILYSATAFELDDAFIAPMRARFLAWANAPAADDPDASPDRPLLTTYALRLHRSRPDLPASFPDVFGRDRPAFIEWFIRQGFGPLRLDPALIAPTRARFLAWGMAPAADDPTPTPDRPLLTTYAVWLYRSQPEVQADLPDLFGRHRRDVARWFLHYGASSRIDSALLAPVRASLKPTPTERAADLPIAARLLVQRTREWAKEHEVTLSPTMARRVIRRLDRLRQA